MRSCIVTALLALAFVSTAFAGAEHIIKQRAKELSNQNNVRQGVPPATPPAGRPTTPQQPVVAAPPAPTPQQQALTRLQTELASIRPEAPATPEKRQQLARALIGAAFGESKPSLGAATRLAESLSAALSQKLLSNVTRNRLLQDLNAVLNPAKIGQSQMNDVLADIQAIFQANGIDRKEASAISANAGAVVAETRKTAAK